MEQPRGPDAGISAAREAAQDCGTPGAGAPLAPLRCLRGKMPPKGNEGRETGEESEMNS